jgi:hypothetical protein
MRRKSFKFDRLNDCAVTVLVQRAHGRRDFTGATLGGYGVDVHWNTAEQREVY